MSDLFWPGDERAGPSMGQQAFLDAMVSVEQAWLDALVSAGIAPAAAKAELGGLLGLADVETIASQAESGGNPVIPMLRLLRDHLDGEAAAWLHRGLTSQDVVDSALMLCSRAVLLGVRRELVGQVRVLRDLAAQHRATPMVGRTLAQHAVPITFGLKASGWLTGVLDAAAGIDEAAAHLPVQVGGAAGTLAAAVEWAALSGLDAPDNRVAGMVAEVAASLGLAPSMPWHTSRGAVTRVGDALVSATDAWGRIASDVVLLSRPELGELSEPAGAGRGGSSTMPHKQNPVLSVLIRRAAITAPGLAATLHTASAFAVDERPDGAWHVEWATLRTLSRQALVAGSQATELVAGVQVHAGQMRQTLAAAQDAVLAERESIRATAATDGPAKPVPVQSDWADGATYLGATDAIVTSALERADAYLADAGGGS